MCKVLAGCLAIVLACMAIGCGPIPKIRESRTNLPPWEKLPPGSGITYVEKFTHDPGLEPLYLAKLRYDNDEALRLVVDTFGLQLHPTLDTPLSFVGRLNTRPAWYPLQGVTRLYVFPESMDQYCANLWVNEQEQTMVIERSWW